MCKILTSIGLTLFVALSSAQPFTYQGMLKQNGQPVNGTLTMTFTLYHTLTGDPITAPITRSVSVQNGLFTVALDFGSLWYGPWLELEIKIGEAPNETVLSPRVKLTGAPYAINALYSMKPWEPNGSAIFYNGGNVGIGTYNPWALLSLGGGNANTKLALWQGNATGQIMGLGVGAGQFRLHLNNSSDRFSFLDAPNGNELVTIKGDGNVGIGTSSPGARLSLGGGNANTKLALWQGNTAAEVMGLGVGAGQFRLHLNNSSDRFSFLDAPNGSELVTIKGNGNVGIGTRSPEERLDVRGNLRLNGEIQSWGPITLHPGVFQTGDDVVRFVDSAGNETMRIHSNGNVGIGTTAPYYPLHVVALSGAAAIMGSHMATSGYTVGVYGESANPSGYGVYSYGQFTATGTKSFQIDHPLDPENYYLNHFCTEGPEPYNAYSGNVTTDARGYATVQLPPYFEAINRDFRYQLTVIDASDEFVQAKVVRKIQNNQFVIRTSKPFVEVSWRVEAVRNDRWVQQYGFQTEQEKPKEYQGKYLHPELYGQPKERGIFYHPEPERPAEPAQSHPNR